MKNLYKFIVIILCLTFSKNAISQGYTYQVSGGSVNSHGNISPTGGTMLVGGAEAGASAEVAATTWFLNKADGGDYLVIRTGGTGGQASWVWSNFSSSISSAAEISIDTRAGANNATVAQIIRDAEAVFFAGGDQTTYVDNWKDTEVENALNYLINTKQVPIGGTSAGMAILGGGYYAPAASGVLSSEILNNPYNSNMTNSVFYDDFLQIPYLSNVITDTHLDRTHGNNNENRYGRLFGLLARSVADKSSTNRYAIGCEEGTFVCVESNGVAKVYGGSSSAYFARVNCVAPETIQSGNALIWNNSGAAVKVYVIQGSSNGSGNSFNLNNWSTASGGGWMNWLTSGGYNGFNFINGSGASTGASAPTTCETSTSCNTPSGLSSGSIGATSATLSWSNTSASSYTLQYRVDGTSTWTSNSLSGTSSSISGLSASTTYQYRVRSVCSSSQSSYSSIASFTTSPSGGGGGSSPNYCTSSGGTQYEFIDEVGIGSTYKLTGDDGGYGDYTNFTFSVDAGNSYTLTIYPDANATEIFVAWIDFNQDGDFTDSNEEVFYTSSRRTRVRGTISIPSSALSGNTRMRVAMKYANDGEPTSCENFTYGEVEDYTISISGGARAMSATEFFKEKVSLSAYPNPTKGLVNVITPNSSNALIEVFDVSGRFVKSANGKQIDISEEKAGIYLFKISAPNINRTLKFVKE